VVMGGGTDGVKMHRRGNGKRGELGEKKGGGIGMTSGGTKEKTNHQNPVGDKCQRKP